jgi:uncharacterized protein (DUF58 family)
MRATLRLAWQQRLDRWMLKRSGTDASHLMLTPRRIYILPTRAGLTLGLVLLAMLIGSINFQLNLGYLLTFGIAGAAVVAMNQTFRNLAGLTLQLGEPQTVHAGEHLMLPITVCSPSGRARWALRLTRHRAPADESRAEVLADLPTGAVVSVTLPWRTEQRGAVQLPPLRLYSTWPLGLWRAWTVWRPAGKTLVWPHIESPAPALPAESGDDEGDLPGPQVGHDEFAGLRDYMPGDSMRRIAWRVAARRDDALPVKQFEGLVGERAIWLDWASLPARLSADQKAARLCAWVLESEARAQPYGLRLPGAVIEPDRGAAHRKRCLDALALA